jgi:lipoprotein-releasing system ATP-binding protein
MAFLTVADLHKSYAVAGTRLPVLRGLSLAVEKGEMIAVVGASGVGKSTLLHLLGGLDHADAGEIRIGDVALDRLRDQEIVAFRNRHVGFVFQFHHLLPEFSAVENVMLPMMADRGRPDPSMEECAVHLLREVGLERFARRRPSQLSGGQQQRVAIARALAMSPRLVLADEPTGNLDTHSADEVFALLRQFNRKAGVTFLVVTHDPRLADRCDRIVEMVDGRIVADRPNRRDA